MASTTDTDKYHTIKNWDKPRSGMFSIFIDAWWCVDADGNPLFYSKHNYPQCNSNRSIAERLAKGFAVKQLPVVYVPVNVHDYT